MQSHSFLKHVASCGLAMLLGACATSSLPSFTSSELREHLDPAWIKSAKSVRSGQRTIYYHGVATAKSTGKNWTGIILGDVLVLDPAMAMIIPAGRLTLSPGGAVRVEGEHSIVTSDRPAWKQLLHP